MTEHNNTIEMKSMLPVGTLLQNGKYRIERYLSSGGFGNTYVATNVEFEERVAIKEFFMRGISERDDDSISVSVSNELNSEQFTGQKEKFKKEARRLRRLKEEHIVSVHDLFEENGTAYYVMDYIEGESLSSRLKRTGKPLSETEALNILNQVLDALDTVHAEGIFHLDIKPANIMIDNHGQAMLIDFGASKQTKQEGGATTSTGLCYTPGYAPIEQMAQNLNQFGPWTDIYALGASLYYMLTLHPLPSPADLLEDASLLQMENLSPKMQQLIRRMMTPVRTKRPQSIAEVRRLLDTKPENEETQVIAPPPISRNIPVREQTPKPNPQTYSRQFNENQMAKQSSSNKLWIIPILFVIGLFLAGGVAGGLFLLNKKTSIEEPNDLETANKETVSDKINEDEVISVNGVSFKMVCVQGGTFIMGATDEQGYADEDEYPTHNVTLSSFSIGETEVTQELWQAVMGYNPSTFKGGLRRPVEEISWNDCQSFINQLNSMTGRNFRLPTEAEWEYAARGGQKSNGYMFAGSNYCDDVAWNVNNSNKTTHDVGSKSANELGLYDMSGNVWEWCQDRYGAYSSSSQTNPVGSSSGDSRVYRGGSGGSQVTRCRVTSRRSKSPESHFGDLGLRLAL